MADASEATKLFSIPELLELILLALPCDTTHVEIRTTRFIYSSRTTCRTWHTLLQISGSVRQRLYLPSPLDTKDSNVYHEKSAFPPARPNPWIPHLLLSQRSWGTAYPFDNTYSAYSLEPSKPKYWTFSFELSRAQYSRLPRSGARRNMLATSPPFTDSWYTRSFYELGSGRAPFVTHLDYDGRLPRAEQRYRVHCAEGVTLGTIVDAATELLELHSDANFVLVESLRVRCGDGEARAAPLRLEDDRPTTRSYLPGSFGGEGLG